MKNRFSYALLALLLGVLACNTASFPPPDPTAAPLPQAALPSPVAADPTFTPIPTLTPDVGPDFSSNALQLVSMPFEEKGDGPVYVFTAQIPQLQGSDDARVVAFNQRLNQLVMNVMDEFRKDILQNQPVTPFVAGSSVDIKYALLSQRDAIWSFKFDVYFYYDGAAHPSSFSITINYDMLHGQELTLDDLFLPDLNYLQFIADYCKADLATRDIGFTDPIFQTGADPTPENYQRWNLAEEGFMVTFDVYQVAPYAAGPQVVIIPYAELRPVSNLNGVLQIYDR